jgi:hypothetical protein
VRELSGRGSFEASEIGPLQQGASPAGDTQTCTRQTGVWTQVDVASAAQASATHVTFNGLDHLKHTCGHAWIQEAVALRPARDHLGALGRALAAQRVIQ